MFSFGTKILEWKILILCGTFRSSKRRDFRHPSQPLTVINRRCITRLHPVAGEEMFTGEHTSMASVMRTVQVLHVQGTDIFTLFSFDDANFALVRAMRVTEQEFFRCAFKFVAVG